MNELRIHHPFDPDPLEANLRQWLRPWRGDLAAAAPQIRIDLHETDEAYTVKADIPGVRKEDIDVRVEGRQVTIGAEVKQEKDERKEGRVLRSERQIGWASRSFTLASDVDEAKAQARYADGVLELTLPKRSSTPSKRLTVA